LRTAVMAAVNPVPGILTVAPPTASTGSIQLLTASGGAKSPDYAPESNPVTWSPITGLYTNSAATIVYTGGITTFVYANPSTAVTYTATATNTYGCTSSGTCVYTVPSRTLNLSFYIEGLYTGNGTMKQAANETGLPNWPVGIADKFTVELHNASNYGLVEYTVHDVALTTMGTATLTIPLTYSGSYYITIRHRNSIQTCSATPVTFSGSTVSYTFDAPAAVFGGNVMHMSGAGNHYAIFSGDITQDDIVDSDDRAAVDNLAAFSVYGYLPEDVNGDGLIDADDMAIIDNCSSSFVNAVLP